MDGGEPVADCPVVVGSAFMILTGGIDDDDGKNSSPDGVRLAVLVVAPGMDAADDVPANVAPSGATPGDATTAAAGGRGPPAGQPAT